MITGPVRFDFNTGNIPRSAMAFWCVMIPATLFDELGLLDEAFSPGMGEDGDFCIKADLAGYKSIQVPFDDTHQFGVEKPKQNIYFGEAPYQVFPIMHRGSATFGQGDYSDIIERNKNMLNQRYGNTLEEAYHWCVNHVCDIHEHFPTLRKYASQCERVVEFGTRGVFSTYALMAARPKRLLTYDLELCDNIWVADRIAKEHQIDFAFLHQDTTKTIIEQTDLLFIDTWHTYRQLKRELQLHESKVTKWIILHDTTMYGDVGEDGGIGIWPAVEELRGWRVKERFTNNNGLTVLERE